ncbi:hypothetical protein EVAR_35854_1 [Eumeta japonica]|uniref:Uncharacterized protein n=1 Tax=Eumeta variegata TaxID=151549 RepID=A0A4C1WZV5_EUMVA|nr:hypothetical protein EVAR_35854_1 [Eumeta japonica]
MIGFSQKSLESVKLSKSTVHCVDDKKNDECSSTTNETLSAVAASDVEDVAIEEINIINKNNASNIVTELCHLCGWAVPMQFYTEHLESKYHKKMVELVQAVLERMKNSVNQICVRTTKNSVPMGIQYCCLCNCTLGDEAFKQHSHSNMHKDNMNVVGVIEQAVRVLQSSGSNQLSEERTEGLASVESGLEECVTVTGDMKINEKLDNIKLDHTILVPNVEKQQNSVDCCNERDEACSVDMSDTNQMQDVKEENSKGPHYDTDVTVVDITSDLVTLQIEGQKFIIDKLSYHGVYPKPGNTLWCVLCKSKKNEDHFTSEEHLKRLNEIKFNGVDLIRYCTGPGTLCALAATVDDDLQPAEFQ